MNGLRWSWPELKATGVTHTVDTPGGRRAGFLVRSTTSSVDLGYIWPVGNAWMWRTPDGKHFGERSSQTSAVRVLREAYDLTRGSAPRLPFDDVASGSQGPGPRRSPGYLGPQAPRPQAPQGPRPRPQALPGPQAPRPQAPQAPGPQAPQAPGPQAAPMKRIVWGPQAPDLTSKLAALLHQDEK